MANTQSKCIPYAKDCHRLTCTNVALATAGGNAGAEQSKQQPRSHCSLTSPGQDATAPAAALLLSYLQTLASGAQQGNSNPSSTGE